MPTLRHLIDDLEDLDVDPSEVKLPGRLYDDLLGQVKEDEEED